MFCVLTINASEMLSDICKQNYLPQGFSNFVIVIKIAFSSQPIALCLNVNNYKEYPKV